MIARTRHLLNRPGQLLTGIAALVLILIPGNLTAQPSEGAFGSVEIHASPPNTIPRMRNRFSAGRYELGNATVVDLIRTAWDLDADRIIGGPGWLEADRFDLTATAPTASSPEALRGMLRTLLEDRFHLVARMETRDLPVYAMTAGKNLHLKTFNGEGDSGCMVQYPAPGSPRTAPISFECRNTTMAAFSSQLPTMSGASGYLFNYRVVDRTSLKGAWNFSLKWSPRTAGQAFPAGGETVSLFAALENQLGLKLELTKAPSAVLVIRIVRKPEGNLPSVIGKLPEFEVASIKPDASNAQGTSVAIQPGGRIRISMTLKWLIWEAWGNLYPERMVGGPGFMDATQWVIVAKAPAQQDAVAGWNGPVWNGVDVNSMRMMLRTLLMDRFKLVAHMEDRQVSGYALVAVKPKLRKADASSRTGCKEGPGADQKDPRMTNPMASRLVTCRNITLAQFAAELSKPTSEENPILFNFPPVVDETGIEGRYDITLNFSPSPFRPNAAVANNPVPSEPDGTISIFDALEKQLGLKLKSRKVVAPVLVIDSVNEMPTEN